MLTINNLEISFKKKNKSTAYLKDISFSVKEKEFVAIVGESGSGKSLTALSIMKLLPGGAFISKGDILFKNKNICKLKENQMRSIRSKDISMIFQDPLFSLNPLHTIEKQIQEVLLLHNNISKEEAHNKCLKLLGLVGLNKIQNRLNSYPHQFSGGQRQRIMIAIALANSPKLLIADEPTTALDIVIEKQIICEIKKLQQKTGMSILFITHNIDSIADVADRICVLKDGKIIENKETKQILNNPEQEYTKLLLSSAIRNTAAKNPLQKKSHPVLTVKNIKVSFPSKKNFFGKVTDETQVLKDINFTLSKGETLGILGESGSGKTTLLYSLLNIQKSCGEIIFDNDNIKNYNKKSLKKFYKKIQLVSQDPFSSLNPRMSIEQIIAEALDTHYKDMPKKEKIQKIENTLKEVNLNSDVKNCYPHEFSGGQRQRIAIARALILEPKVILFDEPTSALDFHSQKSILSLLENLQKSKKISYIFISHDLRVIKYVSHRVLIIKEGKIIDEGTSKDIFSSPENPYTKNLISQMY